MVHRRAIYVYAVAAIIFIGFLLRNFIMAQHGLELSLNSDDAGYLRSARTFLETGLISYHYADIHTVHIMPGQTLLLAAVLALTGDGAFSMYAAISVMHLLGLASIFGVYLLGDRLGSPLAGLVGASLLAISPQHVLSDNLLLTEAPFTFCLIYILLFLVDLSRTRRQRYLWAALALYIVALMLRPTIAFAPICAVPLLLASGYPWKLLLRQGLTSSFIVLACIAPWWIRNLIIFQEFIPFTAGSADPLLLGTYQGSGYPASPTYAEIIAEADSRFDGNHYLDYMDFVKEAAVSRMQNWWASAPSEMLRSYLFLKPQELWSGAFYPIEVLSASTSFVVSTQRRLVQMGITGLLLYLAVDKGQRVVCLTILALLLYFTFLNSYYFAYSRYVLPLMPIIYLGVGLLVQAIINTLVLAQKRLSGRVGSSA